MRPTLDAAAARLDDETSRSRYLIAGVLLVALSIRIYYLVLTHDQPVWWDEAEYLIKARALALGTFDTGFRPGRPLLLSFVMAGVYAVGLGELTIRVGLAIASTATVYLTYRVGLRIIGRPAAVIAAALFSFYCLPLFYSNRVMTETPSLALSLLGVELFLSRNPRRVVWSVPALVLAALTRYPAALMCLVLVVYDVSARHGAIVRSRAFVISMLLGGLAATPYLIWAGGAYGTPLYAWQAWRFMMPSMSGSARLRGLLFLVHVMRNTLGWVLCGLAVAGVATVSSRAVDHGRKAIPAHGVLIALWVGIVSAYFCLTVRPLFDRYFFLMLPPLFMLVGVALVTVATLLGWRRPRVQLALLVASGIVASLMLWRDADRQIRQGRTSYAVLRDVGEWLQATTGSDARVMSQSVAQITYYSDRAGVPLAESPEAARAFLRGSDAHYLVISNCEVAPPWLATLESDGALRTVAPFSDGPAQAVILHAAPVLTETPARR